MQQIRRSAAIPERLRVTRAPGHLRGELVRPESAKGAVERNTRPGESIFAQEGRDRERILSLGHRMQVPAIELAELLAVFAKIEPDVTRQAGPVGVAFFQTDVPAFETDEDFRVRIRIERRLKADFELSRIEVVALHAAPGRVAADISRDADFRIELSLVALPSHRLCQGVCLTRIASTPACSLTRRGAQCRETVEARRGPRRGSCGRSPQ